MAMQTIANLLAYGFGALCLSTALPFVGIPFPRAETAAYYKRKNEWNAKLSGHRITPATAGVLGAALRVGVGLGVIFPETREVALFIKGAVVSVGTMLAYRDGRPMRPQWTMLGLIAACFVSGRLAT